MRAVAESDSPLDAAEREMLSAAQRVFGTQIDIDTLPPITPAETAAALSDPQLRWQLAHGLIVMALSDGRPKKATRRRDGPRPHRCLGLVAGDGSAPRGSPSRLRHPAALAVRGPPGPGTVLLFALGAEGLHQPAHRGTRSQA